MSAPGFRLQLLIDQDDPAAVVAHDLQAIQDLVRLRRVGDLLRDESLQEASGEVVLALVRVLDQLGDARAQAVFDLDDRLEHLADRLP